MSEFTENPISFYQDVGDGSGEREFWYTPSDRTLWIEPEGVNAADVTAEGHASMHNGMLPITENSTQTLAQFLWKATRPYREHFDLEAGGQASQLPDKKQATDAVHAAANNGNGTPPETEKVTIQTPNVPTPPPNPLATPDPAADIPPASGMPYVSIDIDTYVALKNAPIIENQAIIMGAYQKILAMRLEPDDPIHELVDFLQESAEKLRETYDAE